MRITKTITRIWMLIALLMVATAGYAQKIINMECSPREGGYTLKSRMSFSGSIFKDVVGKENDSYRVIEAVISSNDIIKVQCSASCLFGGKTKANYTIEIGIHFTKENGSAVKSPVNGGGKKTSKNKPLDISCKVPKDATHATLTISCKGSNGTQADPSTICHVNYKIRSEGNQSGIGPLSMETGQLYCQCTVNPINKMGYTIPGRNLKVTRKINQGDRLNDIIYSGYVYAGEEITAACARIGDGSKNYETGIEFFYFPKGGDEKYDWTSIGAWINKNRPTKRTYKIPKYVKTICIDLKLIAYDGEIGKTVEKCSATCTVYLNVIDRPGESDDCGCDKKPNGDRVDSKYRFNELWGEVSIRPYWEYDDAYEFAEYDTPIFECDLIRTKEESGCILGLTNGVYHLGPESKLLVKKKETPKVSKLEMIVGSIWGNIKKMAEGKTIELEMSHCVTAIKGTIVAFEETGKESRVYLFAGKVEVTGKTSKKKTMLKAGQASIVGSDGKIKVQKFDIEKGAKKFGIPMKDIKNHYSNTPTSSSKGSSTKVSSSGTVSEKVQKRYAMQRGVIKYKYAKGKQTGAIVRSFDSYGHYERVASKVKGSSATSLNIYRGEKAYKVDTKAKTVTQSKHEAINFLNITEAELSKHKLKKKGTATVAGKQCVVYGNANEDYYVWQGITLKKVVNSKDGKIVSEAVSITQPAKIDANKFKVPSNYKMK